MTRPPYPTLARTVGLLLGTLLLAAVLAGVTVVLFPDWPDIAQMAAPTEIALAVAILYAIRRTKLPWREAIALHPVEKRSLAPLVLVVLGSVTVFSELYVVIQRIVPVPEMFESMLRDLLEMSGTGDMIATLLIAVVIAPTLEEALFRGVLLQGLARRYGPHTASFWTAVFFALFHLYNPWQILPTFFLGLILAWVVLATRTLVAAIIVHSVFNGLSLAIAQATFMESVPSETPGTWFVAVLVLALLLGSLALLIGLVWLEGQTGGGWFGKPGDGPDAQGGRNGKESEEAARRVVRYPAGSTSSESRAGPYTARG
ncbi:MAG TPA: CPBP family intramembrane glutamic endopeptidase [Gemmatimonadota bacterium]|nr:CPBP family intramembrane glutamic endopeptidase [Gemmatimonadota bacterium]